MRTFDAVGLGKLREILQQPFRDIRPILVTLQAEVDVRA